MRLLFEDFGGPLYGVNRVRCEKQVRGLLREKLAGLKMSKTFITILACCALASVLTDYGGVVSAQDREFAEASAFEVASIKPNTSGSGQRSVGFQPGGRFTARNMTLRGLVAAAYGTPQPLPLYRIVGGPGWIDSERFDVDAKARTDLTDLPGKPGCHLVAS